MLIGRERPRAADLPAASALRVPVWLLALAVGLLALAPRALGLADFFTIDESYHWIGRVANFSAALGAGDWAATNQTGHPGVTTMWLGALGDALAVRLGVPNPGWAGGGAAYLALVRLPLAVANSLAVAIGYLLLRRRVRPSVALVAALLWATSPFLIAHGRLLHLDALLTSFMTLSLLALPLGDHRPPANDQQPHATGAPGGEADRAAPDRQHSPVIIRPWSLVLSGLFAGLALLTKAPSLLLLPTVGLTLLAGWSRRAPLANNLARIAARYGLWLAVAALAVFALWPAMWVGPLDAAGSILREIRDNGGQPHHSGNYFLGEPVGVPDARFYPAVVLWRTTPLTLLGLLACAGFAVADARRRRPLTAERRALLALAGFALLFMLALTLEAKRLDRYLLPIFPALEILAAAGIVRAALAVGRIVPPRSVAALRALGVTAMALFTAGTLAIYHPAYLSYFNPLLGGGAVGERVMLVGLGEGMEQVGAWLSARPDLSRGDVLSWIPPTLAPFVPITTLVRDLRPAYLHDATSYAVLYVRSVQHKESAEAEAYVRQTPALFTLRMHGVEYASVHQLPRPFATPRDALFGEGVHLRGFSQALSGGTLVITPSWDIQADMPGDVVAFVHLLGPDGARVAQVDAPLDQGMFAGWQAGQQFDAALPLQLPADLPAGEYRVALGLYRPDGGQRLALRRGPPLPEALDGPQVLDITTIRLP